MPTKTTVEHPRRLAADLAGYVAGALWIARGCRAGSLLPGESLPARLLVARRVIRLARCALRIGRLLRPDEKDQILTADLQPYEFAP